MASSTNDDDELGLDDGDSSEGSYSSDADSKEGTKSNGGSVDKAGETGRENRKPRRRGWTELEERRFRVYIEEKKGWEWIATQFRRSEDAVKQHWRIMNN
jgi:hypothetical protein